MKAEPDELASKNTLRFSNPKDDGGNFLSEIYRVLEERCQQPGYVQG